MFKGHKKVVKGLAIILSICLCLSSLLGDYMISEAASSTTVYFLNSEKWGNVYAYVWGDSESLGSWPGTKAQNNGGDWYSVTVPRGAGFNVIFNNGNGGQAGNVYITDNTNVYLTMKADAKYASKTAAQNAMGYVSAGNSTTRVYFYNSPNWSSVSAYVYGSKEALGSWPGRAATSDGNNWYYVDVPMSANDGFSIIFNNNNNGSQAGDVYINDTTNVYLTTKADTKYASKDAAVAAMGGTTNNGNTNSGNTNNGNTGSTVNPDLDDYKVNLNGVGANQGYTTYEAENAKTNGTVLSDSRKYMDIQSEASGRKAVILDATGEYVEFTLTAEASGLVLRYSIPDSSDGNGLNSTISVYVNGSQKLDLGVTSKYAWVYGGYPYNNNVGSGEAHRFYDEVRVNLGQVYPAGTKIKLQKDSDNNASRYVIDFVELEKIPNAGARPSNSLSVTDYGAVANDGRDDRAAFVSCISAAKSQGKEVWIPAGTFNLTNEQALEVNGVTIRGAGMWHSNLVGAGVSFSYSGSCKFYDFAMTGVSTYRDDGGDLAGFEGKGNANGVTIQNIWMEHIKVGVWSANTSNLVIQGCRIRNTYADGINLCSATNNSVVRNNSVRNTGDDGIASWPWQANCTNNVIEYNTVQFPMLANGIALYGGGGWKVANNHVSDIVVNGSGICIGTDYDSPSGFTGKVEVYNNILERCGSYHKDYKYPIGAIWFWATKHTIASEYSVHDNQLINNSYEGILFDCFNTISNVSLVNNTINGATDGIYIRGSVAGSVTVGDFNYLNANGQKINKENTNFTVNVTSTSQSGIDTSVKYRIVSRASGKCLDIEGGNASAGANVLQWQNNGGTNQQWYLVKNSDGSYTIKSVLSGKVLDVEAGSTADGGNIIVWDSNGQNNQKWTINDLGNGYYSIISKSSGKSIDVEGGSTANGGNVLQWGYHGGNNQQWKLEAVR